MKKLKHPGKTNKKHAGKVSPYSIRSLVVGLNVLEAVAKNEREWGVTELAEELKLTKFQIFRHLHTLCDLKFVNQSADTGQFTVGSRLYELIQSLSTRHGFIRNARREILQLVERCGHTVTLAKLINDRQVMILDVEPGRKNVQYLLKIGASFSLHASAHGKVALAFGPKHLLDETIAGGLHRYTEATITDPAILREEIERVRQQGWASVPDEFVRGINAVAAPILSRKGYEGSISIFGSTDLVPATPSPTDLANLLHAAKRIGEM